MAPMLMLMSTLYFCRQTLHLTILVVFHVIWCTLYIIYFPVFVVTILSSCHLSWFFTRFVTRLKRRMPLVKWEPLPFQSRVHSGYSEVCVAQCLVLCVGFCGRSLSVALSYSFWSLHCMSFFDLRLLNTIWYLQNVLMTLVILSSFTKLLM